MTAVKSSVQASSVALSRDMLDSLNVNSRPICSKSSIRGSTRAEWKALVTLSFLVLVEDEYVGFLATISATESIALADPAKV